MEHGDRHSAQRSLPRPPLFWARSPLCRVATPLRGLVGLALLQALLLWFGIAVRYPLAQGLRSPGVTWPNFYPGSLAAAGWHGAVYALLLICYLVALRLVQRAALRCRSTMLVIIGGWLLASLALLRAYPGESRDIFDYLFRGRLVFLLHASPLAITPDAFPAQPFYSYVTWRGWVDTYGPIWEYASGATAGAVWATGSISIAAYITGYRLLAIGMTGLCASLIGVLVQRSTPALAPLAVLAWLWNPLVLISTALGAHNDVIMLVFVLLTFLLVQRQRWLPALLALWLAAHVKLTALLLLPVLGLWLVRQRGWRAATAISLRALGVALPLSWLLYAPLGGWATLPRMLRERTILIYNSPANIVYSELQHRWGWHELAARHTVTLGSTLLFVIGALGLLLFFWRRAAAHQYADTTFWRTSLEITLAYLLVGSFWFQSWYVLWVLAIAALLPRSRWTQQLLPFYSLGALWSNLATDFLNQTQRVSAVTVSWVMVITLLTPMVCVRAFLLVRRLIYNGPIHSDTEPDQVG
ncbi:MAG: hypothetical protein M3R24_32920 [Chloroflexota bacterium]|nr:hypothetical protein [Chloroflexota bacterium]PLS80261.1 MAG: hypothetical protein CYG59_08910 [Chloroflexota bacterium]